MNAQAGPSAYALLTDGTTIEIRPARPDDFDAVRDMHAKMSPANLYLRFFSVSQIAAEGEARRVCREPAPDHAALLAVLEGQVVGCGSYEVARDGSRSAEVAMAVADDMHRRGVGTLLLEHLVSLARGRGVRTFIADTLTENALMMQVFADAGLGARRALVNGVYEVSFPLLTDEGDAGLVTYRDAVAERERSADVASLQHVLTPASVRLVGPTCFGVANTAISLDATFAARHPRPGMAGLALQSGGVGIVLLEHLSRLGVGISSCVSLGDKDDVSGTDMLLWWKSDAATKLAVLYLDSLGNPRKFARTARAVGRTMPILTVNVGRSATGLRLAAIRATAAAIPQLTRQALFEQAGVIATANFGELLDAAALMASQPAPAGRRIGVVSNTRGGGRLAADACGDAGLQVASLADDTQRALRDLLPSGAAVAGPVDTTAVVASGRFRQCLELVGADPGVNAVLALTATTATSDLVPEVSAARLPVPIAAAVMDQVEVVRLLPGPGEDTPRVPAYTYPESAARALGHAARHGEWRATPPGNFPDLEGLDQDRARELVVSYLAGTQGGDWLPREETIELLGCYRVPLAAGIAVTTEDGATAAAARFDGPVAVKAEVPGLVRSSDARAVVLDLHGADEVRRGFRSLRETFGDRLADVVVQPMIIDGVKVKINVLEEQVFGPLVLFGLAGSTADVLADRATRLAPLTESDADDLIRSVRAAPLLLGRSGAPAADLASLRGMLLRVSQLVDDLPQVAELELSPVVVRPDGALALDARVRIQAAEPADAYLRQLR